MKRTRKWEFVKQEVLRLAALGLNPHQIAKRLELSPSTVTRWKKAGKLDDPGKAPRIRVRAAKPPKSPAEWAKAIRENYTLDATDEQLVCQGEQALAIAYNLAESPSTRLAAMGRFQSIVKQLALVARTAEEQPPEKPEPEKPRPSRPVIERSGVDPRTILQAVK